MSQKSKQIGLWTATSLVVGNMIGSGIFMLPATLALYGGISLVGWVISGAGAIFIALVYSWLSKMIPVANGGPYAYTREGLGEFAAFLVAWGYWISIWCTNAAIAVAFVSYLSAFFPTINTHAAWSVSAGLGVIWFLTWINTRGIKEAGIVQLISTIMKLVPLALISVGGLFYLNTSHFSPWNLSGDTDFVAITATATLTLFAFLGLESATIPSGSIAQPEKTVARATMLGTGIVTLIYLLGTVSVMGIIPPDQLKVSQAPFADAAAVIWGEQARYWVAAGAIISTFGALNGWILLQGQIPAAAAKDKLFPKIFGRENKKQTPVVSIVVSSVLVSALMCMNFSRGLADTFKFILLLSTLTVLIPYLFSMVAYAILLYKQKPSNQLITRMVVALVAFCFSLWAVAGSGQETVYWGFILLMVGLPFYAIMKIQNNNLLNK